jgi:hypothetical protein
MYARFRHAAGEAVQIGPRITLELRKQTASLSKPVAKRISFVRIQRGGLRSYGK